VVKKNYAWDTGATLDEHSKQKHKILKEYFREYLITRCKLPQQEKFRLAIIDGFSGAGKYKCGAYGSPLIFVEVLKDTACEINISRAAQGMRPIEIECFFVFNDLYEPAIEKLKENLAPLVVEINESHPKLHIQIEYMNVSFDEAYIATKQQLVSARYRNVIFNLDQCGYTNVNKATIEDIMSTWKSAEIFLTFSIQTLRAYLSVDREKNRALLNQPKLLDEIYTHLNDENGVIKTSKKEWLGIAEQIIFENLKNCAPFVSPFSINNPKGWRYWLIHFANNYRARQVYNNVLHDNSTSQAHFGRLGLDMLSYDPTDQGKLYLFDRDSRTEAKKELFDDIPRLITEYGDAISVEDFYMGVYNGTAAHSDDIHEMIIENPDLEVITPSGGERRKASTIKSVDTLRLKAQKSMFPMFFKGNK